MKKNAWAGIAILSLLLGACGSSAPNENTISPEDTQATAVAAAFTIVAETQAAIPTDTAIPPTDTPVPTPLPTETLAPSPTPIEAAGSPTIAPTLTSVAAATKDPCNKPLTSWQGPSAYFTILHEYSPQSKDDQVVVSMWVMTELGECGFLYDLSTGPVGQYSVLAFVNGQKNFKSFGSFRITEAHWDIAIRNESVVALASCYPKC